MYHENLVLRHRILCMSVGNTILHNKNSQKMDRNSTKYTHTHTIYIQYIKFTKTADTHQL